jgi:hypothetical protein
MLKGKRRNNSDVGNVINIDAETFANAEELATPHINNRRGRKVGRFAPSIAIATAFAVAVTAGTAMIAKFGDRVEIMSRIGKILMESGFQIDGDGLFGREDRNTDGMDMSLDNNASLEEIMYYKHKDEILRWIGNFFRL